MLVFKINSFAELIGDYASYFRKVSAIFATCCYLNVHFIYIDIILLCD